MNQASQTETREIVAELKALIIATLETLDDNKEHLQNDISRTRANAQDRS
jgi:hypothetical protein